VEASKISGFKRAVLIPAQVDAVFIRSHSSDESPAEMQMNHPENLSMGTAS